jgi:predicted acylesterase/phospholipase RssA
MIQHLILSGGGAFGFSCYGALRELNIMEVYDMKSICSIYATSVGSMLATMVSLKYNWTELDDFIIKRPWNQVFSFNMQTLFSAVERRGLFDRTVVQNIFKPLLEGKDLDIHITMKEFYEYTNIDFHCFSTEINGELRTIDFSHTTHPDWKLLDVIYCSSCLPILFSPYFYNDKECFIDGGLFENYPIDPLFKNIPELDPTTVLGIKKECTDECTQSLTPESSFFDYILYLFQKIIYNKPIISPPPPTIAHELTIQLPATNIYDVYLACTLQEERKRLIQLGVMSVKRMLQK